MKSVQIGSWHLALRCDGEFRLQDVAADGIAGGAEQPLAVGHVLLRERMWQREVSMDVGRIFKRIPEVVAMKFVPGTQLYAVRRRAGIAGRRLSMQRTGRGNAHDGGEDKPLDEAHV